MGNTVGSRGNLKRRLRGNTGEARKIRENAFLSETQRAVLVGTILGDGCLAENADKKHWRKHWKKNFRLKIEQSDKHREYIFWLYTVFKNWTLNPPKHLEERKAWRFYTVSHPELTEFRKIFYRNRKKIIPENIENFLFHPLSLAVWFMDDGLRRGNGFSVCVHSFSNKDIQRLRRCLLERFNLPTNIHWDGKGHQLYFPVCTISYLNDLVLPYVIPSMRYKFPLTP